MTRLLLATLLVLILGIACGPPANGAGAIVGARAFPAEAARSTLLAPNGFLAVIVNTPLTCDPVSRGAFSQLGLQVTNLDGGPVTPGVWTIDGRGTNLGRIDFSSSGDANGLSASSGSITITRLESGHTSGSFSAKFGPDDSLSGWWDGPTCP